MKLHIRDGLWLIAVLALGIAWWNDSSQLQKSVRELHLEMDVVEDRLKMHEAYLRVANEEADVFSDEVRRLRGVVKSSVADQRDWFELEVKGKTLVAVRPGTSESNLLTLDTVERIEAATGLEARRLRHFLTPIPELQLGRSKE